MEVRYFLGRNHKGTERPALSVHHIWKRTTGKILEEKRDVWGVEKRFNEYCRRNVLGF